MTRAAADPILAARTIAALMGALDDVYGWKLPRSAPAGTVLAALWAVPIAVVKDPEAGVLYRATATQPFAFAPALSGTVVVDVLGGSGNPMHIRLRREDTRWPSKSPSRPARPQSRRSTTAPARRSSASSST